MKTLDTEAEKAVLGCVLFDDHGASFAGNLCLDWFNEPRHVAIASTLISMYAEHKPIGLSTLVAELGVSGKIADAGGLPYIAEFDTPSTTIGYWIERVQLAHARRKLQEVCCKFGSKVLTDDKTEELISEFESDAHDVRRSGTQELTPIKELVASVMADIDEACMTPGKTRGVVTGFPDLDKIIGGLRDGMMFVIAARPSVGKTSLAMNIAENVSVNNGIPVGVMSLEMSGRELLTRMVCSRARVNSYGAKNGLLNQAQLQSISGASAQIMKSPLHVCELRDATLGGISSAMKGLRARQGIKLGIIDYLGMISAGQKSNGRYDEVSKISNGLKRLAREINIPLIVCAQLNRESDRANRPPILSDLRDSGAIEQDADIVAMLDRRDETTDPMQPVQLIVRKNRNGPTGVVNLLFSRQFTRFDSAARPDDETKIERRSVNGVELVL